jgi:hypothetical protein
MSGWVEIDAWSRAMVKDPSVGEQAPRSRTTEMLGGGSVQADARLDCLLVAAASRVGQAALSRAVRRRAQCGL